MIQIVNHGFTVILLLLVERTHDCMRIKHAFLNVYEVMNRVETLNEYFIKFIIVYFVPLVFSIQQ